MIQKLQNKQLSNSKSSKDLKTARDKLEIDSKSEEIKDNKIHEPKEQKDAIHIDEPTTPSTPIEPSDPKPQSAIPWLKPSPSALPPTPAIPKPPYTYTPTCTTPKSTSHPYNTDPNTNLNPNTNIFPDPLPTANPNPDQNQNLYQSQIESASIYSNSDDSLIQNDSPTMYKIIELTPKLDQSQKYCNHT